jgi:flagellin-like hook-associated protein FlgL
MPIVLNTNSAATEATFNLSKANDNLRRSIARLSSGNRITKPTDDAGGLAVAYKLQSSVKRTEASLNNHQNALSFLQVQDGVLEAMGDIVDRMSELRTMAADVSKNAADVENYSKEFLELQDQLAQMKREKFNGVELFAVEEEWDTMKGLNKSHLKVNGSDYINDGSEVVAGRNAESIGTKELYEYFDHPDVTKRTNSQYDKYEFQLYTNPSGVEEDGNIKLNIVNLQFMLGIKDPGSFGIDKTQTWEGADVFDDAGDADNNGIITGTEWNGSAYDTGAGANNNNSVIDADEITAFEAANPGWELQTELEFSGLGGSTLADYTAAGYDVDNGSGGIDATKRAAVHAEIEARFSRLDTDGNGALSDAEYIAAGYGSNGALSAAEKAAANTALGIDGNIDEQVARFSNAPKLYTVDSDGLPEGNTISISNTVNLAGLNQPTLDPGDGSVHLTNNSTDYSSYLNSQGYIKDITKVSIEEFTNIIEKIADARAENGAEQQRVNQSLNLHQNNLVNLEAAHGRIMDVDVALESTRFAKHNVLVQASASMTAQANQLTQVALTLLQ